MELAAAPLPGMQASLITNGTALLERQVDRLLKMKRVRYLNVSLNFDDPVEYEEVIPAVRAHAGPAGRPAQEENADGDRLSGANYPRRAAGAPCDRCTYLSS